MKISRIQIENFRGKNFDFHPKTINLLLKENGYGKSTIMDAVRYGLTGLTTKDNVRNMSVTLEFEDGFTIKRSRSRDTECHFNGERVTVGALNTEIQSRIGIPIDTLNAAWSADVLLGKSPAELLQILIRYIPEKLNFDRVMLHFEGLDDEIYDECKKALPEEGEFEIDRLSQVYLFFFNLRKEEKTELATVKSLISRLGDVKEPVRPIEKIEAELAAVLAAEGREKEVMERRKDYENRKKRRVEQEKQIQSLKEKLKSCTDTIPTDTQLEIIETKRAQAENARLSHSRMLSTVKKNIELYEKTLAGLSKPVCPISEKLICTTDKTGIKNEIESLLSENREAQREHEDRIRKAEDLLSKCRKSREIYDGLKRKHNEFLRVKAQLEAYEKNLVTIPEEPPAAVSDAERVAFKARLQKEKKDCENYALYKETMKTVNELTKKIDLHTKIIDAFSDKGVIKNGIVKYYLDFFENACNERANELGIGYSIKLVSDNGVRVYAKADHRRSEADASDNIPENNGTLNRTDVDVNADDTQTPNTSEGYHPVSGLSGGEVIIVSFLLMDMLNQSSGARLLFLDEVEAIDYNGLCALSNLMDKESFRESYDNVFIGGVDHEDVVSAFNIEDCGDVYRL